MKYTAPRCLLALLCAGLLVACGTTASQQPAAAVTASPASQQSAAAAVTATEFRFDPSALTLKAGQATTLTFKNGGQTLHDFTLASGPGIPTPEPPGTDHMPEQSPYHVEAEAGKQATLALNLPAGTYTFMCSVPGHKDLGMQGTIRVQ